MNNSDYYRNKLFVQDNRYNNIIRGSGSLLGKRNFKEAFGYDNDYEVVQNPNKENIKKMDGYNWIDSYSENLFK